MVTVSECTETAFRAAIAEADAGDTVEFGCDGTIVVTQAAGDRIAIDKELIIDGAGRDVTLSGGDQNQILDNRATLTLRDLTFANGRSPSGLFNGGGAIINQNGALIVDRVRFLNNAAESTGGAIWSRGPVGSVAVSDSVFVGNVAFCNALCRATGGGGAISTIAGGPTTITGSSFEDNRVSGLDQEGNDLGFGRGGGGAILGQKTFSDDQAGPIKIVDSSFTGNSAPILTLEEGAFGGGAVMVHNHELTIAGSTFAENTSLLPDRASQTRGGAVLAISETPAFDGATFRPHQARISRSSFAGNQAADGGAVYAVTLLADGVATPPLDLDVIRSEFSGNVGSNVGAIRNARSSVEVRDSLITGNEATGASIPPDAGGIGTGGDGASTLLKGTTLSDNVGGRGGCNATAGGVFLNRGENSESPGRSCGFDLTCGGRTPTILGSGSFEGSAGRDVIVGLGSGADEIAARGGDDFVCGRSGMDELRGGAGNDFLSGGPDPDVLRGGPGTDSCREEPGDPARPC